jgi:glycosyltransferase involved in cell wall biosynthesis
MNIVSGRIKLMMISETTSGGVRKHIVDLLKGLNKNKYDITFVFSGKRADAVFQKNLEELKTEKINLIELPMERNIRPIADIKSLIRIRHLIKNVEPDVIHLHAAKAGALGRLAALLTRRKKIIYNPHGGSFHKFKDKLGFIYFIVEKLLATKNVHFIGVSEYSCKLFEETLHIDKNKNHVIYNGIEANNSAADEQTLRLKFGLDKNDFIVLYPAMFYSEKGHSIFLDTYKLMNEPLNPRIKILFAGNGPLEKPIKEKVAELNLSNTISFLGFVKNIEDYLRLSDLIILPSQKEFLPYAILEAMSYSKPILATNTGAICEMIAHGFNGELFELNNISDFWKRMNYYCNHPEELRRLSMNSIKILEEKFSLYKMINKTEYLYDSFFNHNT